MTWLVAHMWIALAGAAVAALLLGWSVRGMLLLGKLRRAEVDRDVARVELGEARDEIERLFASQRKLLAGQGEAGAYEAVQVSPQADPALEQKLAETIAALQAARDELDALKSAPPVLAPAPELAAMPSVDAGHTVQVTELENRVAGLEAELSDARNALTAAEVARAEAVAAGAEARPAEADPKLEWKASYLAQRVRALEDQVATQPVAIVAAPAVAESAPETAPAEAAAPSEAGEETAEEELARLRWRNRFLEGRLAYFEGDAESVAEEIAEEEVESAEEDETYDDDGYEDEDEADEEETDFEAFEGDEAVEDEDAYDDDEDEDEGAAAAEAILGRLEEDDALADAGQHDDILPARPLALDGPVENTPDDLTLIGGIGPRIQEVLNSLGIYHYDQIADWSPENIAWIDDHLNFHGRVKREGWVEQAAVLVGESVDP